MNTDQTAGEILESVKKMKDVIRNKISLRYVSNKEIISIISQMAEEYPELRFGQILCMLDLDKDRFYEESVDTLESVKILSK